MDRRSWPWKKKSSSDKASDKTVVAPEAIGASLASAESHGDKEKSKKVNYVQVPVETYAHLTGLEDQVKTLNDEVRTLNDEAKTLKDEVQSLNEEIKTMTDDVNVLNDELSSAHAEMTAKEKVVKQHAKVAEEAVSGWEKAEAEALALKQQLETVSLSKHTAEDRAAHLDGALKECMRQIRNLKDDHEKKLHDVIQAKTIQCDKIKLELEAQLDDFDQQLHRASAENAAISRSLQERSSMLMKISEEKSRTEAEVEHLKANIESCEREISSLKYELHIASKELEIRNEEKNMSVRSAEVANKQHLEGVKKIAKLEAECQRLRGLVRKKLPGPAALAQMKLEVESLGRDYGETRSRRSPSPSPTPHVAPLPEISLDQQCHKETEFLTSRLLAMEEETKMLKEALAKRNSELQSSRNICAKTASKLRSLEAQVQLQHQQKNSPKSNIELQNEGSSSQNASNPPSLTSMSEDGIDEEGSVAESWATALISELSHLKKPRNVDKVAKSENSNQMEIMDDFLEMERLACLPSESNGTTSISETAKDKGSGSDNRHELPDAVEIATLDSDNMVSSNGKLFAGKHDTGLATRISMIFESCGKDADAGRVLEDIKQALQDIQRESPQDSERVDSFVQDSAHGIVAELAVAVSQVRDFVASLGKQAKAMYGTHPEEDELGTMVNEFSHTSDKVLCNKMSLDNLVVDLSHVLATASKLKTNMLGCMGNEGENNSSDCIDKVTLLEKKVVQDDSLREKLPNGCAHSSPSVSDPEILNEGRSSPGDELNVPACQCSMEEFEQMKVDKDSLAADLARCTDDLEHTKAQLSETELLLTELKSQLAFSQNSNSLAETQLKCMAESYKLLEKRALELEAEVSLFHAKNEALSKELQEEKQNHQDALAKCTSLQEEIERNDTCSSCALSAAAESEKLKQEREIVAAAEKLAECQETIFLLGRQLKAMRPSDQTGSGSPHGEMHQTTEGFTEDEPSPRSLDPHSMFGSQDFDDTEHENTSSSNMARASPGSPSDLFNAPVSPSHTEANHYSRSPINSRRPKHRPTKSSSSSSSSAPTPEKQSRGISRFFSSKAKSAQ